MGERGEGGREGGEEVGGRDGEGGWGEVVKERGKGGRREILTSTSLEREGGGREDGGGKKRDTHLYIFAWVSSPASCLPSCFRNGPHPLSRSKFGSRSTSMWCEEEVCKRYCRTRVCGSRSQARKPIPIPSH